MLRIAQFSISFINYDEKYASQMKFKKNREVKN